MTDLATAFVPRIGSEAAQRCAPRLAIGGASFVRGLGITRPSVGSVLRSSSSFGRSLGLSQVQRWALEPASAAGSDTATVRPPIDYWPFADDTDAVGAASRREVAAPAPEPPSPARAKPAGNRGDRVDALRRMIMGGGATADDAPAASTGPTVGRDRAVRPPAPDHVSRTSPGRDRPVRRGLPITMRRQGRTWAGPSTAPGRTATTAAPQATGSVPAARVEPTRAERSERSTPGDGAQEERRAVRSVRARRADPAERLRRALQASSAVATDAESPRPSARRSADRRVAVAREERAAPPAQDDTVADLTVPSSTVLSATVADPDVADRAATDRSAPNGSVDPAVARPDVREVGRDRPDVPATDVPAADVPATDDGRRPGAVVRRLGTAAEPGSVGGATTPLIASAAAVPTSATPDLGSDLGDDVRDLTVAPPRSADVLTGAASLDVDAVGSPTVDPLRPLPLATIARRLPERRTSDRLTVRRLAEPSDAADTRPAGARTPTGDRPHPVAIAAQPGLVDSPAARPTETPALSPAVSAVGPVATGTSSDAEIVVAARIGETQRSRIRRSADGRMVSLSGHPLLSSVAGTESDLGGDDAPSWRPTIDVERATVAPTVPAAVSATVDAALDAGRDVAGGHAAIRRSVDATSGAAALTDASRSERPRSGTPRPDQRRSEPLRPDRERSDEFDVASARHRVERAAARQAHSLASRSEPLVDARPGSLLGANLLRRTVRAASPYRLPSFAAVPLEIGRTTDADPAIARPDSTDDGARNIGSPGADDAAGLAAVRPAVARSADAARPVDDSLRENPTTAADDPRRASRSLPSPVEPATSERLVRRDLGGAPVEVSPHVAAAMATVRPASATPAAGAAAQGDDVDLVGDRLQQAALLGRDGRPAPTAVRARANDLAERFLAELVRHRDERPAALPTVFRSIADVIVGGRTAYVSTSEASRRALAAVGKQAATTGDVVHLADPALLRRPSPQATTILAHELTHVAHAAPEPRFFDDDRDSAEERRAHQVGELMRSAPLAPRVIGAPMSSTTVTGGPASTAGAVIRRSSTTASSSGGSGTVSAEQLAARLTGSPAPTTPIRRSPDTGTTVRRALSTDTVDSTTDTSGGTGGGSAGTDTLSPREFERLLREHFDLIVDLLEQRIIVDLERRGGRFRGDF